MSIDRVHGTVGATLCFGTLFVSAGVHAGETDWDLYAARLINRARMDPAGEAARIGSPVIDSSAPMAPLAYQPLVAEAAGNHNTWMFDSLDYIDGPCSPASFTHRETMNCTSSGSPATSTPGFTGVNVGNRLDYVGYDWSSWGENIITNWSTSTINVDANRVESYHLSFWQSSGHRANMLNPGFTTFGHHIESHAFAPPLGGISAPFDNICFATQNYSRPPHPTTTMLFGLLYDDADGNGEWTPRPSNSPMREGLGGVVYEVRDSLSGSVLASGMTLDNGAFSVNIGEGMYDVVFESGHAVHNIFVDGENTDIGDITGSVCAADTNGDGAVGADDLIAVIVDWGTSGAANGGDVDGNGIVNVDDLSAVIVAWGACP